MTHSSGLDSDYVGDDLIFANNGVICAISNDYGFLHFQIENNPFTQKEINDFTGSIDYLRRSKIVLDAYKPTIVGISIKDKGYDDYSHKVVTFALSLLNLISNNFSSWLRFSAVTQEVIKDNVEIDLDFIDFDYTDSAFRFADDFRWVNISTNTYLAELSQLAEKWKNVTESEAQLTAKEFAYKISGVKPTDGIDDLELCKIDVKTLLLGKLLYGPCIHMRSFYSLSTEKFKAVTFDYDSDDESKLIIFVDSLLYALINEVEGILTVGQVAGLDEYLMAVDVSECASLIKSEILTRVNDIVGHDGLVNEKRLCGDKLVVRTGWRDARVMCGLIVSYLQKVSYNAAEEFYDLAQGLVDSFKDISYLWRVADFMIVEDNLRDYLRASEQISFVDFLRLNGLGLYVQL